MNIIKLKKDIRESSRKFYEFEGKVWNDYKCEVDIDTVHLNVTLPDEVVQELLTTYDAKPLINEKKKHGEDKAYEHMFVYYIKRDNIYIKLVPKRQLNGFNTSIQLQKTSSMKRSELYEHVFELLTKYPYTVRRLDIAFNFKTSFVNAFNLARHGSQKRKNYDNGCWTGSYGNKRKKCTTSMYKRSVYYHERFQTEKQFEYDSRFEVRLHFSHKEKIKLHTITDELIISRLQDEIFIPDITLLDLTDEQRQLIKASKLPKCENEHIIRKSMTDAKWTKFRQTIKDSPYRAKLDKYYLDNKETLFKFLNINNN